MHGKAHTVQNVTFLSTLRGHDVPHDFHFRKPHAPFLTHSENTPIDHVHTAVVHTRRGIDRCGCTCHTTLLIREAQAAVLRAVQRSELETRHMYLEKEMHVSSKSSGKSRSKNPLRHETLECCATNPTRVTLVHALLKVHSPARVHRHQYVFGRRTYGSATA